MSKSLSQKIMIIFLGVACLCGISPMLYAKTVDPSKIVDGMCQEMIPNNSNSVSSSSCVKALNKCQEDLNGQLLFSINHYNDWASVSNKDLIAQDGSTSNYKTSSSVYQEVIEDEFLTKHERANITLGGPFGNTKYLYYEAFENPTFDKVHDKVKEGCKKTPTPQGPSQNPDGNDPASDPTSDPTTDPSNDPLNDGNQNGTPPSSGNDVDTDPIAPTVQIQSSQPQSVNRAGETASGGGCSMTAQSFGGTWGNIGSFLPFALAVLARKRMGKQKMEYQKI